MTLLGMRLGTGLTAWGILGIIPTVVFAQSATRDLSGFVVLDEPFTVVISVILPPNVFAAGYEDTPPLGWSVTNISEGGSFDETNQTVKWGPYFTPTIPVNVSYDVTPDVPSGGGSCFTGFVSFDGSENTIEGDECLAIGVPAVSQWGVSCLLLSLLVVATMTMRQSRPDRGIRGARPECPWPRPRYARRAIERDSPG